MIADLTLSQPDGRRSRWRLLRCGRGRCRTAGSAQEAGVVRETVADAGCGHGVHSQELEVPPRTSEASDERARANGCSASGRQADCIFGAAASTAEAYGGRLDPLLRRSLAARWLTARTTSRHPGPPSQPPRIGTCTRAGGAGRPTPARASAGCRMPTRGEGAGPTALPPRRWGPRTSPPSWRATCGTVMARTGKRARAVPTSLRMRHARRAGGAPSEYRGGAASASLRPRGCGSTGLSSVQGGPAPLAPARRCTRLWPGRPGRSLGLVTYSAAQRQPAMLAPEPATLDFTRRAGCGARPLLTWGESRSRTCLPPLAGHGLVLRGPGCWQRGAWRWWSMTSCAIVSSETPKT